MLLAALYGRPAVRGKRDYTVLQMGHKRLGNLLCLLRYFRPELTGSFRRGSLWQRAARVIAGPGSRMPAGRYRWCHRITEQHWVGRGHFHYAYGLGIDPWVVTSPPVSGDAVG